MTARLKKASLKEEVNALKRERIISVSADFFSRQGYHNVSLDTVAEALGVTKPFIYSNFRDKSDLLLAVCRRGAEITLATIQEIAPTHERAITRLAQFCRDFANIIIDYRTYIGVYVREEVSLSREGRHEIAQIRAQVDVLLAQVISEAVAEGDADAIDPPVTAAAIGVMISALWFAYRERGPVEREHLVETLTQLCLRMVGARSVDCSRPKGIDGQVLA